MQGGKRFSLLMLEAEERYLSDVGVMHSPMVPAPHHPLPHVRGRLRICTKSIFFEPDPLDLPILRIPLKHVTGVETVSSVPAQGSRITKKEPMFRVQTSMLTSMRADNKPSPYKQHNMDQEHVFTALHSSLDSFLPLIMQLLASSRLSFEKSGERSCSASIASRAHCCAHSNQRICSEPYTPSIAIVLYSTSRAYTMDCRSISISNLMLRFKFRSLLFLDEL
eukprot:766064-Hanusia_phi.AAC.1